MNDVWGMSSEISILHSFSSARIFKFSESVIIVIDFYRYYESNYSIKFYWNFPFDAELRYFKKN